MYNDFEEDIFGGRPIDKLLDIMKAADESVVITTLEWLLSHVSACELLLEKNGLDESAIAAFGYENEQLVRGGSDSMAVHLMGDILSRNE